MKTSGLYFRWLAVIFGLLVISVLGFGSTITDYPNAVNPVVSSRLLSQGPANSVKMRVGESDGMMAWPLSVNESVPYPFHLIDKSSFSISFRTRDDVYSLTGQGATSPAEAHHQLARAIAATRLNAETWQLGGTIYGGSNPLPGASVSLIDQPTGNWLDSKVTDGNGTYTFSVSDGTYKLLVSPPAGSEFIDSVVNGIVIAGGNVTQNVVLLSNVPTPTPTPTPPDSYKISGTVYKPDGVTPAAGVTVYAWNQESPSSSSAVVDESGHYELSAHPGMVNLLIYGGRDWSAVFDWQTVFYQRVLPRFNLDADRVLDITLPSMLILSGRTLKDGQPLADVSVIAQGGVFDLEQGGYNCRDQVVSDENGEYRLALLPGQHTVQAKPPAGSGAYDTTLEGGISLAVDTVQDLVLSTIEPTPTPTPIPEGYKINGTILKPDGVTPAAGITVYAWNQESPSSSSAVVDESGHYELSAHPGMVNLIINGGRDWSAMFDWQTVFYQRVLPRFNLDADRVLDITLPSMLVLSGRTLKDGQPLAGVSVIAQGGVFDLEQGGFYCRDQAVSDENGEYRLALLPGQYTVQAKPPAGSGAYDTTLEGGVSMVADTVQDLILTTIEPTPTPTPTPDTYKISGTVLKPDGVTPASGITAMAWSQESSSSDAAVIDENGHYEVNVRPGRIQLYFMGGGDWNSVYDWQVSYHQFGPPQFELNADRIMDITLPASIAMTGKTTDSNGIPVPGITLAAQGWIIKEDGKVFSSKDSVISDQNGDYRLALLPGTYNETITPPAASGFYTSNLNNVSILGNISQNVILHSIDLSPPLIIGGPVVTSVTDTTARIEWSTNERATSGAHYGTGATLDLTATSSDLGTIHGLTLTDLTPDTDYRIEVYSSDSAGNGPTKSQLIPFRTRPIPDSQSPYILEGPIVTAITHHSAIIEWTTDEPATSIVHYGLASENEMISELSPLVTAHQVTLHGLTADTNYVLKVSSTDAAGNGPMQSRQIAFTTLAAPDNTPPVIIEGPMVIGTSDIEATVVWKTNEPATSGVSYHDSSAYGVVQDAALVTDHSVRLTGLKAGTQYTCTTASTDTAGNGPALSDPLTFVTLPAPDTTAPMMTEGPVVANVTAHSAMVRWITDEPAAVTVEYGPTAELGLTVSEVQLQRLHNIILPGLTPDTTYHYRIQATDASGNGPALSDLNTFSTAPTTDTDKPIFLEGPTIIDKTDVSATISWRTDEPSDSVVDYGENLELNLRVSNAEHVTEHQITLVNLQPGHLYSFAVSSTDLMGNTATITSGLESAIVKLRRAGANTLSFTTATVPDTTPPSITEGPTLVAVSATSALIRWVTNEIADSQVAYGRQNEELHQTAGDIVRRFEHLVTLTNLTPSTSYRYRIASRDTSGNLAHPDTILNFTTQAQPDTTPPTLTQSPTVDMLDSQGLATIHWATNEFSTSQIFFGTNPAKLNQAVSADGLSLSHEVTLSRLAADQTYYFRFVSIDSQGNRLTGALMNFKMNGVNATRDWTQYW